METHPGCFTTKWCIPSVPHTILIFYDLLEGLLFYGPWLMGRLTNLRGTSPKPGELWTCDPWLTCNHPTTRLLNLTIYYCYSVIEATSILPIVLMRSEKWDAIGSCHMANVQRVCSGKAVSAGLLHWKPFMDFRRLILDMKLKDTC